MPKHATIALPSSCLQLQPPQLHPHSAADLAHLDLGVNCLQRLPDALSRCTQLTALYLGKNNDLTAHGLDEETVRLLASLPLLEDLQLPRMSGWRRRKRAAAARARLAAAAPHIREVTFYGD